MVLIFVASNHESFSDKVKDFQDRVKGKLHNLESIKGRLGLYDEPEKTTSNEEKSPLPIGNKVFIVHGRDESIKESVARFIEKLGLEAIILHEQSNDGKTVIEKFETHSSVASFAVVLLTPDDKGGISSELEEKMMPRARQNVVFEMGYFFGKLGRNRVCALYKSGVELPSDIHGLMYTEIDTAGAWKYALAKELKSAGFDIDMNKVL